MANDLSFTWLGHSTFKIDTPSGKTILIDPWVQNNPACPEHLKKIDKLDLMLITHGHFDHIGDAVPIVRDTNPQIFCIFEIGHWLGTKGIEKSSPMNKGGTQEFEGIKVTMVTANHSCGILDDGKIIYGGEACGYVIEFENGFKLYHSGDTNVFGDMQLIGKLYEPDLAMLPIGDHFTMGVREASYACRLLEVPAVAPMHFGTFPVLHGRPSQLRKAIEGLEVEVIDLQPGETFGAAQVRTTSGNGSHRPT